ncbi:MAG: diguanylate cyclase [Deinococcales bacterium]
MHQPERSLALVEQALALATAENNQLERGYALRTLGLLQRERSQLSEALTSLIEAYDIALQHGILGLQRDIANLLSSTYAIFGNIQMALEYTQKALGINRQLNDVAGQVSNLINLGNIYELSGRLTETEAVLLEAIEMATNIGDMRRTAEARGNLGISYTRLQRYSEAVSCLRQALALATELNIPMLVSRVKVNLAEALIHLAEYQEACALLSTTEALLSENHIFEGVAHCRLNLGFLYQRRRDLKQALVHLESGLELCQQHSMKNLEAQFHDYISQTHEQSGDFSAALKHYKLYHQTERELRRLETERQLNAISAQRELDRARAEAELERMRRVEMGRLVEQLEQQTITDPLTGLYNRRYLEEFLSRKFLEAQVEHKTLSVAMLDIDNFKYVNDHFGHAIGDGVLKIVATLVKDGLRLGDIAARYGGEEFSLVLSANLEQALHACERLRLKIQTHAWADVHPDLSVTVTIGICADTTLENHEKMLGAADEKLYFGKRNGKNQVRV